MNSKLLDLCSRILDLVERGDYSNGNEFCGADEERSQAGKMLDDLRKELEGYQTEAMDVSRAQKFSCPKCLCANDIVPEMVMLKEITIHENPGFRAFRFVCPFCSEITDVHVGALYSVADVSKFKKVKFVYTYRG